MTDTERNAIFEEKKQETIKRLLGNATYDVAPDCSEPIVDKNWEKGKAFYDMPRVNKNMNLDTKGVREYQTQLRRNGGYVYSKLETPIGEEAPVVK